MCSKAESTEAQISVAPGWSGWRATVDLGEKGKFITGEHKTWQKAYNVARRYLEARMEVSKVDS